MKITLKLEENTEQGASEYRFYLVFEENLSKEQISALFNQQGFQTPEIVKKDNTYQVFLNKRIPEPLLVQAAQEEGKLLLEDYSIVQALNILSKNLTGNFELDQNAIKTLKRSKSLADNDLKNLQEIFEVLTEDYYSAFIGVNVGLSDEFIKELERFIKKQEAITPQKTFIQYFNELEKSDYFINIDRDAAESFLKDYKTAGHVIIRKSSFNEKFAISLKDKSGNIKHSIISVSNRGFKLDDSDLDTTTVNDLISELHTRKIVEKILTFKEYSDLCTNLNHFGARIEQTLENKAVVMSIQSLDKQKIALEATQLAQYEKTHSTTAVSGDGHTGFAIAKTLAAPFVVVRSKGNRTDMNKVLKGHLVNNGLLVLTGHGSSGSNEIEGNYTDINNEQRLFNQQIERGPDEIVDSTIEAGLKNGDHITIMLCICFGAADPLNNGESFAHKLARKFAQNGISTTIIASEKPVNRFGTSAIHQDLLTFNNKVGIAPEDIRVFTTKVDDPISNPKISIYAPNERIQLSKKGLKFINSNQSILQRIEVTDTNEEKRRIAEKVIDEFVKEIREFSVDFSGSKTIDSINQHQKLLLEQLDKITSNKKDLLDALNVLNRNLDYKINPALDNKRKEINSTAIQKYIQVQEQQEEQAKKQQEVQYQKSVAAALSKIEKTINTFRSNIDKIEQHHFPEAQKKAINLLANLEQCKDKYRKALLEESRMTLTAAGKQFSEDCKAAIADAKSVLERDLNWGDYLENLGRALLNAIIWTVTLGNVNSYFAYNKAKLVEAIEATEHDLKSGNIIK